MKYTVSSIKRRLGALLVLYIHKEWRLKEFSQIRVSVYCGVPQGSLLGPLLFNVFIKDLIFSIQLSSLRLCADETTAYASNTNISALKLSLNQDLENLSSWFASNYFSVRQWQEKPSIDPSKQSHEPALHIGDPVVEIEGSLNILGVHIDDTLCFKDYLSTVLKKVYAKVGALRRLRKLVPADISLMLYQAYILPQLEYCSPLLLRINTTLNKKLLQTITNYWHDMSTFYTTCIRYVLTYAAPAFFYALPKYLKDELVRVEKRAMSIICPGLPYQETIELVNIVPIVDFITGLCSNTFDTIINDPEHRLNRLIQFSGPSRYALRCNRRFIVPKCKTDRFRNSFIIRSCIDNIYT